MRHAKQNQRLSRSADRRAALLHGLVRDLVTHGKIRTTYARAKEAQRVADRLVTLGKEGSIHSQRRAFRILQDRSLVKQVFTDIAPRFGDVSGGYTRVLRLALRRGDGAQQALLALSRAPAAQPAISTDATAPKSSPTKGLATARDAEELPAKTQPDEAAEKPKTGFLEGLRGIWSRKKKGSGAS